VNTKWNWILGPLLLSTILSVLVTSSGCKKDDSIPTANAEKMTFGKIIYQTVELDSRLPNTAALYSINLDNSDYLISSLLLGTHYFRISPNGKTIAYIDFPLPFPAYGGVFEIHSLGIDGGTDIVVKKLFCRQIATCDWSPDNGSIAFDYYPIGGSWGIMTMNRDGSDFKVITDTLKHILSLFPRWSPDGANIACQSEDASTEASLSMPDSLVILSPSGSNRRALTRSAERALSHWSPDGKKIAYFDFKTSYTELWIVDLLCPATATCVIPPEGQMFLPYSLQWLPDNRIVCVAKNIKDTTYSIDIVPANQFGDVREIANGFRGDNDVYSSPSVLCSPDGQTIAVFGNRNKVGLSLYVMKTDGSELQLVKIIDYSQTASVIPGRCQWIK